MNTDQATEMEKATVRKIALVSFALLAMLTTRVVAQTIDYFVKLDGPNPNYPDSPYVAFEAYETHFTVSPMAAPSGFTHVQDTWFTNRSEPVPILAHANAQTVRDRNNLVAKWGAWFYTKNDTTNKKALYAGTETFYYSGGGMLWMAESTYRTDGATKLYAGMPWYGQNSAAYGLYGYAKVKYPTGQSHTWHEHCVTTTSGGTGDTADCVVTF